MESFEERLKGEQQMMGRPCRYVDAWECVFPGGDGKGRILRVLVYDVAPIETAGIVMHESRYVAWDGHGVSGGVINA